ncbi:cation:proton antiporter [Marinicella sp. W31]|uniref:cation:proton antiporter n=1 Tax=Marinicella sp. W31 TaxID=3023713 RepID=UPI003757F145
MLIQNIVFSLVVLMIAGLVAEPVARILRLPFAAVLVVFGFLGSELVVGLGYDTGIRATNFPTLIFYVFLPVLIFESAYRIDQQQLRKSLAPILTLAIPIMLISSGLTATLIYLGINHPGFPFYTALVAGVLLVATDPLAVVSHLRKVNAPARVSILLEGESLFNDALAIVLFTAFVSLAISAGDQPGVDIGPLLLNFCTMFVGGILFGLLCGFLGAAMSAIIRTRVLESILLISTAYGAFMIAEDYLKVSGVMAVLCAGLVMSRAHERTLEPGDRQYIYHWWEVLAFLSNAMVFLLVGVTITLEMFELRYNAIFIAIGAVLVVRAFSVFAVLPALTVFSKDKVVVKNRLLLFWGGTRGAVTVALALSLPTEIDAWWTVQSMAFGVVLFTLFVQAPTVPLLLRKLYPRL